MKVIKIEAVSQHTNVPAANPAYFATQWTIRVHLHAAGEAKPLIIEIPTIFPGNRDDSPLLAERLRKLAAALEKFA